MISRSFFNIGSKQLKILKGISFGLFAAVCLSLFPVVARANWEKASQPPSAETSIDLALCVEKADCFYAATAHQVFRNENNVWQSAFSLSSPVDSIVRVRVFASSPDLWVQTRQNIYRISPESQAVETIYVSSDPDKYPISFSVDSENVWVGTATGIWASQDFGKTWNKRSDLADHLPVSFLAKSSIGFFFAANGEWKITDDASTQTVIKIFDFTASSDDTFSLNSAEESFMSPSASFFDFIETDEQFYLASAKGIFQSQNGLDWKALSGAGLRNHSLTRLGWDPKNKQLFGISQEGFFTFDATNQIWKNQNSGLAKTDMRSALLVASSARFFVANSEGLWIFKKSTSTNYVSSEIAQAFNKLIRLEPSARDIHKHVIQYSDTSNAKIKRWHALSRLSALAPNFSLGKDWGTSNNIDLDRGGTSDPDRFIDGAWDKNRGADLDLSWDLGDFIFSSHQTSIDSREKLMVDQRNDLLAEATRLFYERRRLQAETLRDPAPDEKTHLDRLLRIEELTSLLDAMTDGYLSRRLGQIYQTNTELEELWKFKELKT